MPAELTTPFRQRYERSLTLDVQAQVEECADYLQHPEVLLAEFLESYYLVERKLDPDREDASHEASLAEVVLEPYFDSLELRVRSGRKLETVRCVAGAFAPLPGELHPALERRGVDYIGTRDGSRHLVLGVTDPEGDQSIFSLLLRGLNCLAEVSPPFQMARLQRHVVRGRIDTEPVFELQLGIAGAPRAPMETALLVLSRDLAEVFKTRIHAEEQFRGGFARIECLELAVPGDDAPLKARWRV